MKYSVITVCYNDRIGLERTILSVINQTFTDYEYIIIDGASTDGSVDVIKKYNDNIAYWISEKDDGVYSAMNKGIKIAKGDYCIFMNSGDTFYDQYVLDNVSKFELKADLIVGRASMTQDGKQLSIANPPQFISYGFWLYHSVIHQASFMNTKKLKDRLYDESLRIVSDWKYMFTEYITEKYDYKSIPIVVCRFDTTGISSNNEKRMAEREYVLKDVLPPMLYKEYKEYDGLKYLYTNVPFMKVLNELFKYRTLVKVLYSLDSCILKLYTSLLKYMK